ncbi:DUF4465 domain-containing protein [Zhouia spongiae]|uniref:DUF4465 domain-containing protein n=1 Tax=Zhouia spongiae TaxID=2202721 RepID=A0ABY3YL21_9FLAO|nr:DUF4465 domain-containing protein [Zhouia spongiae]UNY98535.1 DUF4465 domain-containing protein [Zhouia spongiae]
MKLNKVNKAILGGALCYGMLMISCTDELDVKIPYPQDITFNEINLERFSYNIPDTPYKVGDAETGVITVNVSKNQNEGFSGFAVSNKNWRSYPWSLSPDFSPSAGLTAQDRQTAIDSTIFSVFTNQPNRTENYLVGNTKGNNAFITLDKPSMVEHVLVANTTYNYLLAAYGSVYSGTYNEESQSYMIDGDPVRNIQNPNTATSMYGRFHLPGPGNTDLMRLKGHEVLEKRKAGSAAAEITRNNGGTQSEIQADSLAAYNNLSTGYVKLIIEGYNNETVTGNVAFYLAVQPGVHPQNPDFDYVAADWYKVDLTELGIVDKLLFKMESSYVNEVTGEMVVPPYFCLDGIRLSK